jgi:hypothetical protein
MPGWQRQSSDLGQGGAVLGHPPTVTTKIVANVHELKTPLTDRSWSRFRPGRFGEEILKWVAHVEPLVPENIIPRRSTIGGFPIDGSPSTHKGGEGWSRKSSCIEYQKWKGIRSLSASPGFLKAKRPEGWPEWH